MPDLISAAPRIRRFLRLTAWVLSGTALVLGGAAAKRWTDSRDRIRAAADTVVAGSVEDQERVLALLEYTWRRPVLTLRPPDRKALSALDARGRYLSDLYRRLPFNLIPAADVLEYGFAYGGPCGAKSRLLVAMLRSQGFVARQTTLSTADFGPLHTVVEVRFGNGWSPLDPTYNVAFEEASGGLAPTSVVASDPEVFRRGAGRNEAYPLETYTYANVSELSVFYVLQSALRASGLVSQSDVPALYSRLGRVLPSGVLHHDLGVPLLYEEPELLATVVALSLALLFALAARRLVARGNAGVTARDAPAAARRAPRSPPSASPRPGSPSP